MKRILALVAILVSIFSDAGGAIRLKEIISLEGVRENQLMGYGIVVGLAGTGDRQQTLFPAQSLTNLLERMGLTVSPTLIQVKNSAAVMVTGTLPPFAQPGSQIDATISAMGDARSLQGGVLLMTGLKGPDGQVYAVAQGELVLGGYVAGSGANVQIVNHPTVGRIPNGAIVERSAPSVNVGTTMHLQLQRADFTTATRIVDVLNLRFGVVAHADNAGRITVKLPPEYCNNSTGFISEVENLTVEPGREDKIVVNERTGTIVMGKEVRVAPVAIMQGDLTIEIQTRVKVSQPGALSSGSTQLVPQTTINAKQPASRNIILPEGATVEELVRALSAIGSSPRDIIAILQNLEQAGALDAQLAVI